MTYFTNQEQLTNEYASDSPRYNGDSLDELEKQRIRNLIANSKSKLAKMSEIEKTALTLETMQTYKMIREW
jgi:hypothetical protein